MGFLRRQVARGAVAVSDHERVPARGARLDRQANLREDLAAEADKGHVAQSSHGDRKRRRLGFPLSGGSIPRLGRQVERHEVRRDLVDGGRRLDRAADAHDLLAQERAEQDGLGNPAGLLVERGQHTEPRIDVARGPDEGGSDGLDAENLLDELLRQARHVAADDEVARPKRGPMRRVVERNRNGRAIGPGDLHDQDLLIGGTLGIPAEDNRGLAIVADPQLAAICPDRAGARAPSDLDRRHPFHCLPDDLDQLAFERFRILDVVRMVPLFVDRQRGSGVRVDRGQEQLGGLQWKRFEQGIAQIVGRASVEAEHVRRDQDEPPASRFEGQHAGRERIVDACGQVLAAAVAGHLDGFFRGDVDPRSAGLETAQDLRGRLR